MASKQKTKLGWLKALSPIVFTLGGVLAAELPAAAIPNLDSINISQNGLHLAQVGVRSRIVPPTPLNLTPRYHIPLPQSNYRYRSRGYRRDRHYGYDRYDDYHHHHRHSRYSRRRSKNKSPVIIINPATEQHRSTTGSYIRIIKK